MTASTTHNGPFTCDDLDRIEDNGSWYELSYGALIVTPGPAWEHQRLAVRVSTFLENRRPDSVAIISEADLRLAADLVKRPDVMVTDLDGGPSRYEGIPHLVVEIHSPSTRVLDVTEKRYVYSHAGIPAYWMVDPAARTITILSLDGTSYREVAVLGADDSAAVERPFPMTVEAAAIF